MISLPLNNQKIANTPQASPSRRFGCRIHFIRVNIFLLLEDLYCVRGFSMDRGQLLLDNSIVSRGVVAAYLCFVAVLVIYLIAFSLGSTYVELYPHCRGVCSARRHHLTIPTIGHEMVYEIPVG